MADETLARAAALVPLTPKPWNVFFAHGTESKTPASAQVRASKNLDVYRDNYIILATACISFSILTSPFTALLVSCGVAGAMAVKLNVRGVNDAVDWRVASSVLLVYALAVACFTDIVQIVSVGLLGSVAAVGIHAFTHHPIDPGA